MNDFHADVASLPQVVRAALLARSHFLHHTRGRIIPGAGGVRTVVAGVCVERHHVDIVACSVVTATRVFCGRSPACPGE